MQRTLEILQYNDVIKLFANYCVTEEGRIKTLNLLPINDTKKISQIKDIAQTVLNLQDFLSNFDIKYFPPIESCLLNESKGLTFEQIYAIGLFTKTVLELKTWEKNYLEKNNENDLTKYIEQIPDLSNVHSIVFTLIDKDGNLQKTPALRKIENEIASYQFELENLIRHYFTDKNYAAMLQENIPTIKDGRQVLAVKANFKGRILGIVHEYSQRGQTFYIEPTDVVEKNNDIIEAKCRYDSKIKQMFAEASKKIFTLQDNILKALDLVSSLDVIIASTKLAKEKNWVFLSDKKNYNFENLPNQKDNHTTNYSFLLKEAKHPLLKTPVPIDIAILEKTKVLIITGPNAGGKTVALKTICLLALLNQSALPVPCNAKSFLPYFDFIACDIGDEQSIDLSLSTFSSHMKNISNILEKATEKSLIALDELGNGTEVQEGTAIAMAILDELIAKKSLVFVTTHHSALKNYGFANEHCENASVEFDNTTLRPSYKIIMGVPGESHAFDIASKSGLNDNIIQNAKKLLTENQVDVSKLIKDLIEKNKTADYLLSTIKEKENSTNEKVRKIELKELKLKQKEFHLRELGYIQAEKFFLQKRKELENLIRKIREGELDREKILSAKEWLDTFENELQKEKNEIITEKNQTTKLLNPNQKTPHNFIKGDNVFVRDYHRSGIILRKEKNNSYLVDLGNLKLNISEDKLELQNADAPKVSFDIELSKIQQAVFQLRLLGMRENEAKKALTQQLDLALISNLKEFSIVHGKGDGILQKMVHKTLAETSFVAEFYFARPEEGGTGKTFVKLK